MAALVSAGAQNTAITAANAAANGSKRTAYLTSLISSIGTDPKLRLYRDGTEVWEADYSGALAITDFGITIATGTQVSISDADINSGSWEFRVEKASDSSVYIGGTIDDTAATDVGAVSGDLEAAGTITYGTIRFNAPSLDTLTVAERQKSTLATGSNVSSFTVTLPAAAAVSNKLIVPFAWYEGFRDLDDPTDVAATLWLDPSDFSTMWTAVGGTGAVSAVGALVKRIDNKGSAGGCFVNSTGWYLRQSNVQGYYLEGLGTAVFRSKATDGTTDKAASDFVSASAYEVIAAVRPDASAGSSDAWYAPGIWAAGDGTGSTGVTFHSSTVAKHWNNDGAVDVINLTQVQGQEQIFTAIHTGGNLTSAVGFSSSPGNTTASGNTTGLADPFGIGGTYHGSHPMFTGRFFGIVAKNAALTTNERDFVQWYLHRKMVPNTVPQNLTITDNVGNVYPIVASKADAAGKLWAGVAVAHTLIDSASAITTTIQMPALKGFFVAGQAIEVPGLLGEASVDVVSTATNNGSAGSMTITTGTTSQSSEFAVAVFALYNSDTAANISAPSGYTLIGATQNATSPLAMSSAYKVLTSAGAQVVTGTWDSGNTGGAVGIVVTFKAGVNTDTPGSGTGTGTGAGTIGPGGSAAATTVALISGDYTGQHEVNGVAYAMNGVPTSWDWGVTGRAGYLNPPSGWSSAPAITPWYHLATRAGHTPGPHNWRVAIVGIYHHEKRDGVWQVLGTQATQVSQITGSEYLNYQTNENRAANVRTSNGIWEVYIPDAGGTIHGYPTFRIPAVATGAQARATVIAARLTLDNPSGNDDRSGAQVMLLAGTDWWRSMSQQWNGVDSNYDGGIGRARKPSITSTPSLHFQHTMGSDATAIGEYVTFLTNIGLIS